MTIQELITHIFEGRPNSMMPTFEDWVKSSRRFRAFAETYRDKIRKKLRTVENDDALKSLYAELEVAYRLLADQRFVLEYEKYGLGKQRAPDFSIQYRTNTLFNLEITRLRFTESAASDAQSSVVPRKLTDALLDKVGQMLPNSINVLLLISEYPTSLETITSVMSHLRQQAETKQNDYFAGRGYLDALAFLKQFQQLSAVYFCVDTLLPSDQQLLVWHNSLSRRPLPPPLDRALNDLLTS